MQTSPGILTMAPRDSKRLLLVGWDAADWKIIDALFAHERMPTLRTLIQNGVRGDLATLQPALSPLLWTSIATGKTADKHGVLNFIEPDPSTGALRPATSTTRRTKAIWNILTQAGLRTNVVSWYASHPAEPINGSCISNLFQENPPQDPGAPWDMPPGAVHPPESTEMVHESRLHPGELQPQELLSLIPGLAQMDLRDPRLHVLARQLARCASVHNVATSLLAADQSWDCSMIFYDTIDIVGHHFMQYHPPKMPHVRDIDFEHFRHVIFGIYQLQDMMLGRLIELAGPETTVMVLSDHGFHSDHLRPAVQPALDDEHAAMDAAWHRPLGIFAMAGPGIRRGGDPIYGANLLDIAPTALTILGVAVGADMDGRVLIEAFESPPQIERVFSWDSLEGESGEHPADLRLDPFDAAGTMAHLAELGYVQAMPEDAAQQLALVQRETRFNLGIVYMTTRRVREAIPILKDLASQHPDEPRYVINLIQCLLNIGHHTEARAVLSTFLEHHPAHPDAKMYLGMALFAEGQVDLAGKTLEEAESLSASGTRPDLDCMLGTVYIHLKRLDDAERIFQRAAATDPHDARAQHGLAQVALNRENFESAVEHALTAVGLHHFFPDAHYTLGVALTWMKDYPHAIKALEIAVSMQPGLLDAHRYLASIHRHLGNRTDAARHREIASGLIQAKSQGQDEMLGAIREPPMGPQEWTSRLGTSTPADE